MPTAGGASDKFGNRYEALWAFDQLLRIIDGSGIQLTLEPLSADESRGIEFHIQNADNTIDHWSVKRQTSKGEGWSIPLLTARDGTGRSIFGDLRTHVECGPNHRGVFASTLGARDLVELTTYAASEDIFKARLDQSAQLKASFRKYILPLFEGSVEEARDCLLRIRIRSTDEPGLHGQVDWSIRKLFYRVDGMPLDAVGVRGHLADLLMKYIHQPLGRAAILDYLEGQRIGLRNWAIDRSATRRIDEIREEYLAPLRAGMINSSLLKLRGSEAILDSQGKPANQKILVVGEAGGGKSTTLAGVVERLYQEAIPVLPIRFDQLSEGLLTPKELGLKLLLPESPALVLAGIADGGPSVLVLDQLDAVSLVSGRRADLWMLFEGLKRELDRIPGMCLIVGCREFDLEHDHRMRQIKADKAGFTVAKLQPLSTEELDVVLRNAGVNPSDVQRPLKPVLTIPLHLSMFLSLATAERGGIRNREELFNHFWSRKKSDVEMKLGRPPAWSRVIDRLTGYLSDRQALAAPHEILESDDLDADACAMVSEHVLVLADGQYRFFHESFFDYAFARRFAAREEGLLDFLLAGEQHLFRRAQVRQVLAYLRTHDRPRYLKELKSLLTSAGVRFHIKRMIFQWLSSLPDGWIEEWKILKTLRSSSPNLQLHVRDVMAGNAGWFDALQTDGYFDGSLSSGEKERESEAVWLLGLHHILQERSAQVAALIRKHRSASDPWHGYQRIVCQRGDVYHSREMFDLFLSLIDEGVLDGLRPGVAVTDGWWHVLYPVADARPDFACEAIGHWFDRLLTMSRTEMARASTTDTGEGGLEVRLRKHLNRGQSGASIIRKAARSTLVFAQEILPRIANLVDETATDRPGQLMVDVLWFNRGYGDDEFSIGAALLGALASTLESLAAEGSPELDRMLLPYEDRPQDTMAFLVLRALTAAPDRYADRLADYLAADPRRLKVGYSSSSPEGGSAANYISAQAIRAVSARCTPERFANLEQAIVQVRDEWDSKHPQSRGRRQLELLESLGGSRLSEMGQAKLEELRAKFPGATHAPPRVNRASSVGVPISDEARAKMSDDQWLQAMRKYSGVAHRHDRPLKYSGGERELAQTLERQVTIAPVRFARLTGRMPDTLPSKYYDAILRGVAESVKENKTSLSQEVTVEEVATLIRRVHDLPKHPCGRWIAWLIQKCSGFDWPEDVIDVVGWYAVNDPDPQRESWKDINAGGKAYDAGNPHMTGINSTRGSAACAVARLLFDKPARFVRLHDVVRSVAHDKSVAVRSCAIATLLAILDVDEEKAISWFRECVSADVALLDSTDVENFIHYAGYRDFEAVQSVIHTMLESAGEEVVERASRQVSVLGLGLDAAKANAERVRTGTPAMRRAAAEVYATNIAIDPVRAESIRLLKVFFSDSDPSVCESAAMGFRHLPKLSTPDQADLLSAFLDSHPKREAIEPVVQALEHSPVALPDLVCRLVERCVEEFQKDAGDLASPNALISMDISKIVVRLYAQTQNAAVRSRCLNLIDQMELHRVYGTAKELAQLDR